MIKHYRVRGAVGHRGHLVLKTGTWALIAKASAAVNLYLCVPFVLKSLGPHLFGAWATIVSVITLGNFLDFGLGNGAMNLLAGAKGRNATDEFAVIVRTAYASLLKITLLFSIGILVVPFVPWFKFLGLTEAESGVSTVSVFITLIAILAAIPLGVANKIQIGLGYGARAFRWQAIGQLMTAACVVCLAELSMSLPVLVAGATLVPLITLIFNTLEMRSLLPPKSLSFSDEKAIAHHIKKEGGMFFALQLSAALAFNLDLVLVASYAGAGRAAEYSIIQRAFSIIPLSLGLVWVSLWPIYRESLAKGNLGWVFSTFRRSIFVSVIFAAIVGPLLALNFDFLSHLWLGHSLHFSLLLIWGFAFWVLLESLGTSVATLLNAAGIVRYQVVLGLAFAVTCLIGKIVALRYVGVNALPWVTAISYLGLSLVPIVLLRKKIRAIISVKLY